MMRTTIRAPPALSDYTPLAEHQEQTPQSFYEGKPILYYHTTGAKAWIPKSQLGKLPFIPADLSSDPTGPEGVALNGTVEENIEQKVDLFVNSQSFTIFCPATLSGLSIPYPEISIHAIKGIGAYQAVYLQIELSDGENGGGGGDDDDETDMVELTLIPPASTTTPDPTATTPPLSETQKLFDAISECSNLNPDPVEGDEEDADDDHRDRIVFESEYQPVEGYEGVYTGSAGGGLPPPMPGSGGWITAENMHEYFDADGNWIGGGQVVGDDDDDDNDQEMGEEGGEQQLGEGAGAVHARDEDEGGENKRARVE